MGRRSFAGYACEESLSIGLFGECFRAKNKNGMEARVLVVDSRLAKRKRFASALASHGTKLSELIDPHVVTTQTVGRGDDGSLVVIASPVAAPIELGNLIERAGGHIPRDIALSIAMGALRGLSHAHEHDVTHGGVHPRSVIVDGKGISKLSDFGLARALASAAAAAEDSQLLRGLRGYVAPEIALGQEPDIASDVYAAGALVSQLLWAQPSPPDAEQGELVTALRRAVETDSGKRYSSASELEGALRRAISEGNLDVAVASKVGEYIQRVQLERSDTEGLDAETEDLLESLGLSNTESGPKGPRQSTALEEVLASMSGLEDELSSPEARKPSEPAAIDPCERARSVRHMTPGDYDLADDIPLPVPRPFHADGTHAMDMVDLVGQQAATSSPFDDVEDLPIEKVKRTNTLRLLALIAFVFAALAGVAYTKTDFFEAAKKASDARKAEALAKAERMQPKPGAITVLSETEDAAVWLLLGRAPVTSFVLPSSMIHELRIEHEGFRPLFLSVAAQHWTGEDSSRVAKLSATLLREDSEKPTLLPAFPPMADPPLTPGGGGQGALQVATEPAGAEVWMLVGSTPMMNLVGIEAGKDYAFKVLKDGYRLATASFKAEDWYLSGTSGPVKPGLTKQLVLEAMPKASQVGEPMPEGAEKAAKGDKAGDDQSSRKRWNRRHRRKNAGKGW